MKSIKYILLIAIVTLFVKCGESSKHELKTNNNEEYNHSHQKNEEEDHQEDIILTQEQFKSGNMQLGTFTKQLFLDGIKTTGMVDIPPQNKAIISSSVGGNIKTTKLLVGDKVQKGQALVTIENLAFIEMQQNYLEVKEQLTYLKAEYERQELLFKEKVSSQKIFLKAESDYKTALSKYIGMKKRLQVLNINVSSVEEGDITSIITIYSPISGNVSKLNVNKGTYVSPTDEIMEIINTNHIHVELNVFEKDAMRIKKGQKILFKVSESSNQTFEAEVHLVATTIDEETRTVKIHGHLHDKEKFSFFAGMFVEAEIITTQEKTLALPKEAIIENGEHKVILVVEENKNGNYILEPKEVEIGEEYNGFVEVKNSNKFDLKQAVLVKGGYSLIGTEGGGHSH